ncbi:hypothetical protein RJ55_02232 [Drechmeria coniospora]|nr:hypothetical protein RJ55_02232 [Drechmeria coniospora]
MSARVWGKSGEASIGHSSSPSVACSCPTSFLPWTNLQLATPAALSYACLDSILVVIANVPERSTLVRDGLRGPPPTSLRLLSIVARPVRALGTELVVPRAAAAAAAADAVSTTPSSSFVFPPLPVDGQRHDESREDDASVAMPGILPMKVIKVGTSAQSRIAQACDRCRSKKIRCDGVRPTCSQCANVGFECRTSDKLSRRAFPRGYTESLEERVRQLECEVRELKDLLDEKDEKIDMLSAVHGSHRRPPSFTSWSNSTSSSPDASKDAQPVDMEDTFRVQGTPLLLGVENSDSYFMGPSSGRSIITSLKRKLEETGKPCLDFNPDAFLHVQGCPPLATADDADGSITVPPRLFSDRCVNVFFQEWAPLFPALHKPTFLRVYEEFAADPDKVRCGYKRAQLYLVFSIAGLSFESPDYPQLAACEKQWTDALESLQIESTMDSLQCLILAMLYYTVRADNKRLQHYKSVAVGLSHRLGLHQCQKRFSLGALTLETRKKVFWTLYTLDCFTAATMGLPKLLRDEDIQVDYPSDTDDEYITEKGFQPTLPGEYTRLSSALALFRAARILARVLEKVYPVSTNAELSLQQMAAFERELDEWYAELPNHLRLNFVQDKPSTDVTGSRSPLLALAYYYIRTLIYRPVVGSSLDHKSAQPLLSISESSKHMIQISQLLEERGMSFSFCVNKFDLLAVCGITLLYQVVDLKHDSKLTRDSERLVNGVMATLAKAKAPGFVDLTRVARTLISVDEQNGAGAEPEPSSGCAGPDRQRSSPPSRGQQATAGHPLSRLHHNTASEGELQRRQDRMRRTTMPDVAVRGPDLYRSQSRQSFDSLASDGVVSHQSYCMHMAQPQGAVAADDCACRVMPNLDYLSLGTTPAETQSSPSAGSFTQMQTPASASGMSTQLLPPEGGAGKMTAFSPAEWETLLGAMDGGLNNVYDAIYGGTSLVGDAPVAACGNGNEWSPDAWDLSGFNIADFGGNPGAAQSVLSDESLSSGEEMAPSELGLSVGSADLGNLANARSGRDNYVTEVFSL